jgi:hypothetical protein
MKRKPQLYQTSITNHMKKKLTIIVHGGCVQDVVKENIPDTIIEVHDYDVDETDPSILKKDKNGDSYQLLTFE